MHALIVVSHPDPESFTHRVAHGLAEGVALAEGGHTAEVADLAAEGFDPRFSAADHAAYKEQAPPAADVTREQQRIDRADALVLVYPVYWWSFPGLLKGWIDRVFANGWAYEERAGGPPVKRLGRLPVHLVAIGGADAGTYDRHGYFDAMKTQIEHGIFGYCGAPVARSAFLLESAAQDRTAQLETARNLGLAIFDDGRASRGARRSAQDVSLQC